MFPLRFVVRSVLCMFALILVVGSLQAQTASFTEVSSNVFTRTSTDGTTVVYLDALGNLVAVPFGGGTAVTLVTAGDQLPNGLGSSTSLSALGTPFVVSGTVYFGATSTSGSGYYSVPAAGGSITVISDSTSLINGESWKPGAFSQNLLSGTQLNPQSIYTNPGLGSQIVKTPNGDFVFTALMSGERVIVKKSSSGTSFVVRDSALSGCILLGSFATDGSIYAAWARTLDGHYVLLANASPSLSCANAILDLGDVTTSSTSILPGQPSAGTLYANPFAPYTVVDSGYVYFAAGVALADTSNNKGVYSGIFRIAPGSTLSKVIANDTPNLRVDLSDSTNSPLYLNLPFSVRGSRMVFSGGVNDHYGPTMPSGNIYVTALYFMNLTSQAVSSIAKAGDVLSTGWTYYGYTAESVSPTQTSLTPDGKLAFTANTSGVAPMTGVTTRAYTIDLGNYGSAVTSTTLSSSATSPTFADTITLSSTVTGGTSTPTGSVTFKDGATTIGTVSLNASGKATQTYKVPSGNAHNLSASYAGDAGHLSSTASLNLAALLAPSSTTLSIPTTSVTSGQSITLQAKVTGLAGETQPTGSVTFDDGGTVIGTVNVSNGVQGSGTFAVQLPVGTNSIRASFAGDGNYGPSTSTAVPVNVMATASSTTLTASPVAGASGTSVTLTAAVASPQSGVPTGTVSFSANGNVIGTATIGSNGNAVLATTSLPLGTNNIQAVYAGSTTYPGSTSNTVTVTISGFTATAGSSTVTLKQGGSATVPITVRGLGGFASAITFNCSGLPAHTTCAFSPSSVTPTGGPASNTLTISTNVQSAMVMPGRSGVAFAALFGLVGLFGFRKRATKALVLAFFAMVCTGLVSGCGSGTSAAPASAPSSSVTPTGTSGIVVTAQSGTQSQVLNISLVVTQ